MKKLASILIIIGVLAVLVPIIGKFYLQWQENKMIIDWYNSVDVSEAEQAVNSDVNPEEAYSDLQEAFSNNARNATQSADAMSEASNIQASSGRTGASGGATSKNKAADKQIIIGVIKIDKIKIKYPVVEGVAASNLRKAIGHIPGTAGLGQPGNCALAGHRNYTFGRFFNRLDEVKVGDTISVSTKKAEYIYKVYEKLVVTPDDVSVIKGKKDDTELTLITCTPIYIASHRLILHARLEKTILLEP